MMIGYSIDYEQFKKEMKGFVGEFSSANGRNSRIAGELTDFGVGEDSFTLYFGMSYHIEFNASMIGDIGREERENSIVYDFTDSGIGSQLLIFVNKGSEKNV